MSTFRGAKRAGIIAGAVLILATAASVNQATGDTKDVDSLADARATAALATTQNELSASGHTVETIRLEHVIEGHEIYSLSGGNSQCILVADEQQEAGRSELLACRDARGATADKPLATGFDLEVGFVDVIWAEAATSQVATSGAPVDVRRGGSVLAAVRRDDSSRSELRWSARGGSTVAVPLLASHERAARYAAASSGATER